MDVVLFFDLLMAVPVADTLSAGLIGPIEKLDKSYSFFDEATRKNTVASVGGAEGLYFVS